MTLRYLTAGESHGPGLTTILEGLPSGLTLLHQDIQSELARRQQGYGRGGRMKIESDTVTIQSGVRHGVTLGSPIALWIENKDFRAWSEEMSPSPIDGFVSKKVLHRPRPGHADLVGGLKYNHHDLRNVLERASARETTARVAVGAICKKLIKEFGIDITGHVIEIGGERNTQPRPDFATLKSAQENNPVRCFDAEATERMMKRIDMAKDAGDTVGGVFEIHVVGVPQGLGSYVHWDRKLDANIARAILSIQAIKGVEFGLGFVMGQKSGSEVHDEIAYNANDKNFYHLTNHTGGLVGGMTNGEPVIVRGAMKPISTLYTPLKSVNIITKQAEEAGIERSDTCAVPAASVIAENVVAIEIATALLQKFGGDSMDEIKRNYAGYIKQTLAY